MSTPKQRVKNEFPYAGAMLSAMWGWRIVDYRSNGNGTEVLSGRKATHKTEGRAWASADRNWGKKK